MQYIYLLTKDHLRYLSIITFALLQALQVQATNCHKAIDLHCGDYVEWDTKYGHNNNYDYSCFHHSLSGFHSKEIIYRIDRDHIYYGHDIEITIHDKHGNGLDAFIIENCGEYDAKCYKYKENFGHYTFTIADASPDKEYYLIIDGKSTSGAFSVTTQCYKKEFPCHDAYPIDCGTTQYGDTYDGNAYINDYSCFAHNQHGYYGKELMYKVTGRSGKTEDIEITFEDLDHKGLDIFIMENCGEYNQYCLYYKERYGHSPSKEKITIQNADPHKEYYIIIDARDHHVTGSFNLSIKCHGNDFLCEYAEDIYCGETIYGNTHHGNAMYDDYSCFKHSFTGFYEKELIYRIYNESDEHQDITVEIEDLHKKGLDVFIIENCGYDDYHCLTYLERTEHSPKTESLTIYNADPHKEYFIVVDARKVTGEFNLTVYCEEDELTCEYAEPIYCGETIEGDTYDGSEDFHDLSCFNPGLGSISGKGDIYEVTDIPHDAHEIRFNIYDLDRIGLDLFIFENCGYEDASCKAFKMRYEEDPYEEEFVVTNIDPTKTYHILVIDLYGLTGRYELEVLCGEEPLEDDYDCAYLDITPGEILESTQRFYLDYNFTPEGYEFDSYVFLEEIDFEEVITPISDFVDLEFGALHQVGVRYVSTTNHEIYFHCWKFIYVEYPPEEIYLYTDYTCGTAGEVVEVPVKVSNFKEVTGMQFQMHVFDAFSGEIEDVDFLNEELPVNFEDIQIDFENNRLQFAWTSSEADAALSLADESILFVLKVRLTGTPTDTVEVTFSDALAFNNLEDRQIDVETRGSKICIEANLSLQGRVYKETGEGISDVLVLLEGPTPQSDSTDEFGDYFFENLTPGDYTIGALKDDDFRAGVNVIDLALIKSFNRSFGEEGLYTPYQLIAANLRKDLDGSAITVADETAIKRLIAFDIDQLDEYASPWIFIPTDHTFEDPENANFEDFPTYRDLTNVIESQFDLDFIGVKIGDIDGSSAASSSQRSAPGTVTLSFDTVAVTASRIKVPLKIGGLIDIQNLQFSIQWDPTVLEFDGISEALTELGLEETSYSTRFVEEGVLTFVHSMAPDALTMNDTNLLILDFTVLGSVGTQTRIEVISDPLDILVTDSKLAIQSVVSNPGMIQISSEQSLEASVFAQKAAVKMHWPNPVKDMLNIPMESVERGTLQIQIFNTLGKLMHQEIREVARGRNVIELSRNHFQESGTYFYHLELGKEQVTRSFIVH